MPFTPINQLYESDSYQNLRGQDLTNLRESTHQNRFNSTLNNILRSASNSATSGNINVTLRIIVDDDLQEIIIEELRQRNIYAEIVYGDSGSVNGLYIELADYTSQSDDDSSDDESSSDSLSDESDDESSFDDLLDNSNDPYKNYNNRVFNPDIIDHCVALSLFFVYLLCFFQISYQSTD